MTGLSPKSVAAKSWLAHLDPSDILRFKDVFEIRKRPYGKESPQVLSLTNRGIMERDISSNEGQLAESYDNYQVVEPGDFVLNPMDLLSGWVARSPVEGVVSNAYFVFRLSQKAVKDGQSPRFYEYVLQSYYKNGILEPFGKGVGRPESGGGRWTINAETLGTLAFPRVNSMSQNSIVEFLDREIAQIETLAMKYKQLIGVLNSMRKSVIYSACTKGLRQNVKLEETGLNWLGKIPGHWKATPLKWVTKLQTGSTPEGGEFSETSGRPWIRPDDLDERGLPSKATRFFEESALRNNEARPGTTLVCAIGATLGKTGWIDEPAYFNQQITATTSNSATLTDRYLYWSLTCAIDGMKEISVGNTLPILNNDKHGTLKIGIPPVAEQNEISQFLDRQTSRIDALIDLSNKALEALAERRSALISEAVTGKLNLGSK